MNYLAFIAACAALSAVRERFAAEERVFAVGSLRVITFDIISPIAPRARTEVAIAATGIHRQR